MIRTQTDLDPALLAGLESSADVELLRHALTHTEPPAERRIYVNRTLRMSGIRTIGFDLDWTLADYNRLAMTRLAFEMTRDRLIDAHGYPEAIREARFRPDFLRRGVLLDKKSGAVLKMNRHRFVGRAFLGRRRLARSERIELYRRAPINPSSPRFYRVDTLFELPEINLFAELIEMSLDEKPQVELPSYEALFEDVRASIDAIHADDTLKARIRADLDTYVPRDRDLALALRRMAIGGRRLILITNSEWYYTKALCTHLFDGILPGIDSWRDLFDLVIVQSAKPGFFRDRRSFEALDDDGEVIDTVDVPTWGGVYRGGCREGLMRLLNGPGEEMLYVGDHIYGDVVVSKMRTTWRTALIISELEDEIETLQALSDERDELRSLKNRLAKTGQKMDSTRDLLRLVESISETGVSIPATVENGLRASIERLQRAHRKMRSQAQELQESISSSFSSDWGSLFKQGGSRSLFGSQVDDFACLYTSRVSNFAYYGSDHYYRVLRDPMQHEL